MYPVSEAYREAMRAAVRTDRLRGSLTLPDGQQLDFTDADVMSGSVTLDEQCVSGQELAYGCVYLGQAALQLKTELDRYRLYGAKLALWYGVQLPGGGWEEVPLGVYTVAEAQRSSMYVAITAYDNLLALDAALGSSVLRGDAYGIYEQIGLACGVALAQERAEIDALPNAGEDYQLSAEQGCKTYRDALAALCQPLGCFGAADALGRLVLGTFAATACASLGPGQRRGAEVADYHCHYVQLEVATGSGLYAAQEQDATGLTMTLEDAPLFESGLPEKLQRMTDTLFAVLRKTDYTPASVVMNGDPALRCGDRLELTKTGSQAADTVEMLVMQRVWKFRGTATLKAVGANPYLAGVKSKDTAIIRQLQSQTAANKMIFYSFSNPADIEVTDTVRETPAATINFVTVQDTSALFLAQVLLTASPDAETVSLTAADGTVLTATQPGRVLLSVRYYLNEALIADFCPQQSLAAGRHALALFYPFASVLGATNNRLRVVMLAEGGRVEIARGALRATITGQGLAGGEVWDGTLTFKEMIRTIRLENSRISLPKLAAAAAVDTQQPYGTVLQDPIRGLVLPRLPELVVPGLTERLNFAVVEKGHTITTTRNVPLYDGRYLSTQGGAFGLVRSFAYEGTEQPVDAGRMCAVTVLTSDLATVEGIEVM